jgi:superfamily II DNA or RNA helicase
VRHVLASVPAEEWPVRQEAMDALLRRLESARAEGLRVDTRPERGRVLGTYTTRGKKAGARPYRTVLGGVGPIVVRCDCPDFLKNSLANCKHALAVLEMVHERPRLLQQAQREQSAAEVAPGLRWDPPRPLTGLGDWLERVTWRPANQPLSRRNKASSWFTPGADGSLNLKRAFPVQPAKRLGLVEDLIGLMKGEADPALAARLAREKDRLRHELRRAVPASDMRQILKALKRPLYPYHNEAVKKFLTTGRILLADDMGLGKTAQAIACVNVLWRARRVKRGLLIVPASLKPQWDREWAQFSDLPIRVVEGSPTQRVNFYEATREGLLLINYEQLLRDLPAVRAWAPDLIVLDEAQRIKNWATKTALSVKQLDPPYRLVLSGTPMENRIEELASIVEWVDDMALEPKWRLAPDHAVQADGKHQITGVKRLETLRERLRPAMMRRVRQEVLDQLPPRTDTRVPVELTEAQSFEHESLMQPIASILAITKKRPLTQAEFLHLMSLLTTQRIICNGLGQLYFDDHWPSISKRTPDDTLIQGLSAPKLLELRPLVRQLAVDQGRKVVVFSQWRRMLILAQWAIGDLLGDNGLRSGFFSGTEGPKRRTQNLVEFHDDPSFRLLFASDAGGVGLNLQRAANCVINLELPWNPAVLEQRIGRIYRLGQDQPIDVFNLVSEQGIESRIAGLVESTQAFFKGLFDGTSDSVKFEHSGGFLSRVQRLIDPAVLAVAPASTNGEIEGPVLDLDDGVLDDLAPDPFAPIVEAADESTDDIAVAPETEVLEAVPTDEVVPEPVEVGERPAAPPRPISAPEVRDFFSKLSFRRESDGRSTSRPRPRPPRP